MLYFEAKGLKKVKTQLSIIRHLFLFRMQKYLYKKNGLIFSDFYFPFAFFRKG